MTLEPGRAKTRRLRSVWTIQVGRLLQHDYDYAPLCAALITVLLVSVVSGAALILNAAIAPVLHLYFTLWGEPQYGGEPVRLCLQFALFSFVFISLLVIGQVRRERMSPFL